MGWGLNTGIAVVEAHSSGAEGARNSAEVEGHNCFREGRADHRAAGLPHSLVRERRTWVGKVSGSDGGRSCIVTRLIPSKAVGGGVREEVDRYRWQTFGLSGRREER